MTQRLIAWILIALIATGAVSANEQKDLEEFAHRLDLALGDMSSYGVDITERKARSVESNKAWFAEGMPVVGEPAPLLVRNKSFWVICDKTSTRSNLDSTLGLFLRLGAKYFAEKGTIPLWLVRISDLDFARFKNDEDAKWSWVPAEIAKTKAQLATVRPIAKFGEFGLFAGPQVSPEQARDLEALVLKVTHPVLYSGINLTGMKVFEPIRVEGLSYPATGAADLVAAMEKSREAEPAAVAEIDSQPDGARVVGRQVGNDQTTIVDAKGTARSESIAATSTVGPQLKGYDPKEADRPPPSREPPPPQIVGHVHGRGFATGEEPGLRERERRAREERAKQAAKPRLTMADYAKQAERERAEFKARQAKKATDSNNVQIRLINERRAREKEVGDFWAKRRAYVGAQANRNDAAFADEPVEDGPSNSEGTEKWVVVYVHNRTDITLDATYTFWGGPKGDQYQRTMRLLLIPTGQPYRLTLFASPPGWTVKNAHLSWKASPGDYHVNGHVQGVPRP